MRPGAATLKVVTAAACFAVAAAAVLDMLLPPPLHRAEGVSRVALDRNGAWLHAFPAGNAIWRFEADLDEVDPVFIHRLVAVEDKRFFRHGGVDILALFRAGASAARSGRIVSGASTITMQTARLLEPRPRTLGSKLIEMVRAVQIERRLNKREILELYLTLTPYGGNVEGVRAASLVYFGKEPARLTDAEQALLIALPQAPEARRPDRRPKAALAARGRLLKELSARGFMTRTAEEEAQAAVLPSGRATFPRAAYHAALAFVADRDPGADERSTIDLKLQTQAEALVRAHAAKAADGATAALMIVDNRTRAVRALVGSSGFDAPGGWIDLTNALRSPGSTLKPFIYGAAFDEGLAGPDTVIDDMPQNFDGYAPENFDKVFRGEVRASEALQHSLNLPAVELLDRIGAEKLGAMLRNAGAALTGSRRADGAFGLTLALGGAGVTMRDLAALYAGLSDGGSVKPLVWSVGEETSQKGRRESQIISPESAFRIAEILAETPSLEGRMPAALATRAPIVSFKTGTSYGYRDAWAAGFSGAYTVVAWVGRADGAARPGETGRKAAAPLMMDVFDVLARFEPDALPRRTDHEPDATIAITRMSAPRMLSPPDIVFPRDGVEIFSEDRGFVLSARGGSGGYRWYVDGDAVALEETSGRAIWRPEGSGFYTVTVVDRAGRSARSKVRVAAVAG